MTILLDQLHARTRERVSQWAADPDVLGVVWVGSRSRGHGDEMSDDDLEVLLTPEAFGRLAPIDSYEVERVPDARPPRLVYDAQLTTLESLEAKAASSRDLDHWPYERAGVLFDREGRVQPAVAAAGAMDPAFRNARLRHGALDTQLAIGRARKTELRGFPAASRMLVARGAKALSRVVFALENRWVPLDHWLEPELATLVDVDNITPLLKESLVTGRHEPLQTALERLQPRLEPEGFPGPEGRMVFFSAMMHASHAAERAIHGIN